MPSPDGRRPQSARQAPAAPSARIKRPATAYQLVSEVTVNIHLQRLRRVVSAAEISSISGAHGRRCACISDSAAAAAAATELAASGLGVGADAPRKVPMRRNRMASSNSPGRRNVVGSVSRRSVMGENSKSIMSSGRKGGMGSSRRSTYGASSPTVGLLRMRHAIPDQSPSPTNGQVDSDNGRRKSPDRRPDPPQDLLRPSHSAPVALRSGDASGPESPALDNAVSNPLLHKESNEGTSEVHEKTKAPPLSVQLANLEMRLTDDLEAEAKRQAQDFEAAQEAAKETARLEALRREALEEERRKGPWRPKSQLDREDPAQVLTNKNEDKGQQGGKHNAMLITSAPAPEPAVINLTPFRRSFKRLPPPPEAMMTDEDNAAMYIQKVPREWEEKRQAHHKAIVEEEQRKLKAVLSLRTRANNTASKMPSWWRERNEIRPLSASNDHPSKNWYPSKSEGLKSAGKRFDERHEAHTQVALEVLKFASNHLEPPLRPDPYEKAIVNLRRDRLQAGERRHAYGLGAEFWTERQMRQKVGQVVAPKARWAARRAALQKKSIWVGRVSSSEGKKTLETQETVEKMLDADWPLALSHGLRDYIAQSVQEGRSCEEDVATAKAALLSNCWMVYSAFDYLASSGGVDVSSITRNAFDDFIREAELADDKSNNCTEAQLAELFDTISSQPAQVNNTERRLASPEARSSPRQSTSPYPTRTASASPSSPASRPTSSDLRRLALDASDPKMEKRTGWASVKTSAAVGAAARLMIAPSGSRPPSTRPSSGRLSTGRPSSGRPSSGRPSSAGSNSAGNMTMCRHEWLHALVRLALMRYVLPGSRSVEKAADASEAIEKLIKEDLLVRVDRAIGQDSNEFRNEYCYTSEMEALLQKHEYTLRALYLAYATEEGAAESKAHMDLQHWLKFLTAFEIIDLDVTKQQATLAFAWSRMWVVDEHSKVSQQKRSGLSFEDFLEAFIRVALNKGWPSHRMVVGAGFQEHEVSDYIEKLRVTDRKRYEATIQERSVQWHTTPYLPYVDCVLNLLRWCVWNIRISRLSATTKVRIGDPLAIKPLTVDVVREYDAFVNSEKGAVAANLRRTILSGRLI